jgi:putative oxidoreductase
MAYPIEASAAGNAATRPLISPNAAALAGRLLLATLFLLSGINKVTQPGPTMAYIAATGLPLAPLILAGSALIEIGGGIALALGYRTRLAGAVLAAFTLLAAAIFHSNFADQNQFIHFFKDVAITGGLLQVVAFGGGGLSFDSRSSRND